MYSKNAMEMRRCTATRKDGEPCNNFALWTASDQRCKWHTSDEWAGKTEVSATVVTCHCKAYAWPHRPGGGGCRWPDEPSAISAIAAGTRGRSVEVTRFSWEAGKQPLEELIAWFEAQGAS